MKKIKKILNSRKNKFILFFLLLIIVIIFFNHNKDVVSFSDNQHLNTNNNLNNELLSDSVSIFNIPKDFFKEYISDGENEIPLYSFYNDLYECNNLEQNCYGVVENDKNLKLNQSDQKIFLYDKNNIKEKSIILLDENNKNINYNISKIFYYKSFGNNLLGSYIFNSKENDIINYIATGYFILSNSGEIYVILNSGSNGANTLDKIMLLNDNTLYVKKLNIDYSVSSVILLDTIKIGHYLIESPVYVLTADDRLMNLYDDIEYHGEYNFLNFLGYSELENNLIIYSKFYDMDDNKFKIGISFHNKIFDSLLSTSEFDISIHYKTLNSLLPTSDFYNNIIIFKKDNHIIDFDYVVDNYFIIDDNVYKIEMFNLKLVGKFKSITCNLYDDKYSGVIFTQDNNFSYNSTFFYPNCSDFEKN